ncbi:MAG: cytochrome c3 family protein, partial [Acidobacteriota bacterium]
MVFPAFLTAGALIFLYGMRRESLRRRREGAPEEPPYPRLDLNDPRQRRRFTRWMVGGFLGAVLLGFVAYNAFLFTESVTFCGKVCHTVMEPEYTAYLHSPHARVRCVECHVGSGASWYVKSKMSGARQVLAVIFHTYEKPIPVPVKNLRPARETCEECHWPAKFYGAQLLQIPHFRYDEANTAEQVSLVLKTGGGDPRLGAQAGIHWHMILANTVSFATEDEKLQTIPYVHVRRHDGTEETYTADGAEFPPEKLASMIRRSMDCMDCHNRPTHIYPAPESAGPSPGLGDPRSLPSLDQEGGGGRAGEGVPRPEGRPRGHGGGDPVLLRQEPPRRCQGAGGGVGPGGGSGGGH